jgi:hypothetical protein
MPMHNADVAAVFNEIADLLELEEANPFRVRAYRNAARVAGDLSGDVATMVKEGQDLSELPGVGKDLAGKVAVHGVDRVTLSPRAVKFEARMSRRRSLRPSGPRCPRTCKPRSRPSSGAWSEGPLTSRPSSSVIVQLLQRPSRRQAPAAETAHRAAARRARQSRAAHPRAGHAVSEDSGKSSTRRTNTFIVR